MRLIRRPLSLALRLTLLFGVAAAIVFPLFGWIISQSTERHFEAEDIHELDLIVRAVQEVLTGLHTAKDFASLEQRFDDILVGHHSASLHIAAKDGQTVYASPGPDLSALAATAAGRFDGNAVRQWSDARHNYRALIQPARVAEDAYTLVVAVPIDIHLRFLVAFRRTLWLMIACSIFVIGLMGWIAVRQGHAPLHNLVARIRRISADELSTRLPPESVPHELRDLALSFNEMLQRIDAAFHRLVDFNADIAHELRTPITNLMTQTQVALSRARTIDEYREILYSNMEEYERMAQMVGDMLFLAQTDNRPQAKNITELDLAREVQALFDFYEGWAEEQGVALVLEGTATISGDRPMLRRALGNLLSNAIRHTPAGGRIRVKLNAAHDSEIGIVVENSGPEIAPEHLPRLFDRFYRVDPSRQRAGAGLGLAIVKSIIDAHGGRIDVTSAAGCTKFHITLPIRPAQIRKPQQDRTTH